MPARTHSHLGRLCVVFERDGAAHHIGAPDGDKALIEAIRLLAEVAPLKSGDVLRILADSDSDEDLPSVNRGSHSSA